MGNGEQDGEARAFILGARDFESAAVCIDVSFGEGESDTCAGCPADVTCAAESFEDVGQVIGWDPDSVVSDGEFYPVVLLLAAEGDGLVSGAVFDGVGDEVVEGLAEEAFINVDAQGFLGQVEEDSFRLL